MKSLSVIICLISMTAVCHSSVILSTSQVVNVEQGEVIVLPCQYNASLVGRSKISWYFTEHQTNISIGTTILVQQVDKYSISIPQDANNKLNLQIKNAQASDSGHYRCSVGEDRVVHLAKVNTERKPLVEVPPANFSDCCRRENVSAACLPVCTPSTVTTASFNPLLMCPSDIEKLLKCFSDGRNHVGCCRRRKLPEVCMGFCLDTPPPLTNEHLLCLNRSNLIISCFEEGQVHLPTYPVEVSALPRKTSILVNWEQPAENAKKVTGYRVFYRYSGDKVYNSSGVLDPIQNQYTITGLLSGRLVSVYVIAVSDRGSSAPSTTILIATQVDTPASEKDKGINDCCVRRGVSPYCQGVLCRATTLNTLNPDNIFACFQHLDPVFTCLAGERNHSACCIRNRVDDQCLGLCGGQAPQLNASFIRCVNSLSTIEACVQEGLDIIPGPPTQLRISEITWNSATLEWNQPVQGIVDEYYIQCQEKYGNTSSPVIVESTSADYLGLTGLKDNTIYDCQVISKAAKGESLPSESSIFLTYTKPEENSVIPTEQTAILHNFTACCMNITTSECARACYYNIDLVSFFSSDFTLLEKCSKDLGAMMACGSDGRDHSECCRRGGITDYCLPTCKYTPHSDSMSINLVPCLFYIGTVQACFKEGIVNLPRHPDNLTVISQSAHTISISWSAPKTGPAIQQYIVKYGKYENITRVTVNKPTYILQNLKPNTQYTLSVSSYINNTESPDSMTIKAWTDPAISTIIPYPQINGTNATSQAVWLNRTDCCKNSGIRPECLRVCLNQPVSGSQCNDIADKALACAADGRNHQPCCERKNIPTTCLPLCKGQTIGQNFQMASCLTYTTVITTCFIENTNLLPSQPQTVTYQHKIVDGQDRVEVRWLPANNCKTSCRYDVHYWLESDNDRQVITKKRVTSPYTLYSLTADGSKYLISVIARNSYGEGQPSPSLEVIIVNAGVPDVSIAQTPGGIMNQGDNVQLLCDVIFSAVDWKFNSKLLVSNKILKLKNLQESSSGVYTCEAKRGLQTIATNHFLQVRFKPRVIHPRAGTVEANMVELMCDFEGFPKLNSMKWSKDGKNLDTSSSRISPVSKYIGTKGLTEAKLKIQDVTSSDYGVYECSGSNQYGAGTGVIQLTNPDSVPTIVPGKPKKNITDCCIKEKVSKDCMDICTLDVDVGSISGDTTRMSCLQFLPQFTKCGADGRNHSTCCIKKGVNSYCLPFCSGAVPTSGEGAGNLFECISESNDINSCAKEGRERIPKAPSKISTKFDGEKIVVQWSEAEEGAERVTHFKVHHNSSASSADKVVSVGATLRTYSIRELTASTTYNVWIEASSNYGTSQPSPISTVKVTAITIRFDAPANLVYKLVGEVDVLLTWSAPTGPATLTYIYVVTYWVSGSKVQHTVMSKQLNTKITNLDPATTYEAHVQAMSSTFKSGPSNKVIFKSGGRPSASKRSGASKGAAIGIGIGVLLVALLVACILIFIFIKRKRQRSTETVAFENPNYGRGKVQIGGLNGDSEQNGFDYAPLREDHDMSTQQPKPSYNNDDSAATLPVDVVQFHSHNNNESGEI